ncbi:hypothetical protein DTO013E5_5168 [Penicillium roqueforti]|nr:hypothetical protein DTO012A1_4309 [Penicillium roqueforti]KAI2750291.1 hypothetical protein DTO013F2_4754 [Penicillium roqueforti]KAI2773047.1 hypothetical protein DTO012A8_2256 [Penicillium roqueforti]KAI3077545.1 hypothetical protein CBS147339_4571 [Penicillium roqueforti]KAI3098537.1 hypothetical protein CBS147338_4172 [Penicillium roqueforti]
MADHAMDIPQILQSASINRNPDPSLDINPATTASEKRPVAVGPDSETNSIASDVVHPRQVIRPVRRRHTLPPLPDLRFEQSYLASIKDADTWGRVAWITTRDQVLLPLIQGTVWTLALSGWRFWNRNASVSGHTLGSRVRRWWYEVNNWHLPQLGSTRDHKQMSEVENKWRG